MKNPNFKQIKRPKIQNSHRRRRRITRGLFEMHSVSPPTTKPPSSDLTSLLSDELLLLVFSKLPKSQTTTPIPISLVCRRWFTLKGRLVHSVTLLDWPFLESGRLLLRFPNLTDIDLLRACVGSRRSSGILLTHKLVSLNLGSDDFSVAPFVRGDDLLPSGSIDRGLRVLFRGCPNLRKLVVTGASEDGLSSVAEECGMLQELEMRRCTNLSLRGILGCKNLQVLKLVGFVDGFHGSVVSDVGLMILANGCGRIVKLDLCGCGGSYEGIRAIGQCCQMLEELTFSEHRMDEVWISGLGFCENLKTLRLQSCKKIDQGSRPDEKNLRLLPALERLYVQRCHLRDKQSVRSLFKVCGVVREIVVQDCWGLDNEVFGFASVCRRVNFLSLEGCSLMTTKGLESIVLSWVA